MLLNYAIAPSLLIEGANIIAVEVHQEAADSSDLSFDLELSAARNLSEVSPTWSVSPAGAAVSDGWLSRYICRGLHGHATSGAISGTRWSDRHRQIGLDRGTRWLPAGEWWSAAVGLDRPCHAQWATGAPLERPARLGGRASAGSDYQAPLASVTIPAGGGLCRFCDRRDRRQPSPRGASRSRLTLVPDGAFALGTSAAATMTIVDDEHPAAPEPDAGSDGDGLCR